MIGFLAANLLRRHVADRAHHHAGFGLDRQCLGGCRCRWRRVQPRQPEIQDFDAAVASQEDVVGLQVPVDDPCSVRGSKAVGNLNGAIEALP